MYIGLGESERAKFRKDRKIFTSSSSLENIFRAKDDLFQIDPVMLIGNKEYTYGFGIVNETPDSIKARCKKILENREYYASKLKEYREAKE